MFSALANIYKIPELRQKVIFTLIMFAVFRLGTHIPVPGVDPSAIEQLFATGNLFGLLDLFSGGAFRLWNNGQKKGWKGTRKRRRSHAT